MEGINKQNNRNNKNNRNKQNKHNQNNRNNNKQNNKNNRNNNKQNNRNNKNNRNNNNQNNKNNRNNKNQLSVAKNMARSLYDFRPHEVKEVLQMAILDLTENNDHWMRYLQLINYYEEESLRVTGIRLSYSFMRGAISRADLFASLDYDFIKSVYDKSFKQFYDSLFEGWETIEDLHDNLYQKAKERRKLFSRVKSKTIEMLDTHIPGRSKGNDSKYNTTKDKEFIMKYCKKGFDYPNMLLNHDMLTDYMEYVRYFAKDVEDLKYNSKLHRYVNAMEHYYAISRRRNEVPEVVMTEVMLEDSKKEVIKYFNYVDWFTDAIQNKKIAASIIPQRYRNLNDLMMMYGYIQDGRAKTWPEVVNLLETDKFRQTVIHQNNQTTERMRALTNQINKQVGRLRQEIYDVSWQMEQGNAEMRQEMYNLHVDNFIYFYMLNRNR